MASTHTFSIFPPEIIAYIFRYVDIKTLGICASVDRLFCGISDDYAIGVSILGYKIPFYNGIQPKPFIRDHVLERVDDVYDRLDKFFEVPEINIGKRVMINYFSSNDRSQPFIQFASGYFEDRVPNDKWNINTEDTITRLTEKEDVAIYYIYPPRGVTTREGVHYAKDYSDRNRQYRSDVPSSNGTSEGGEVKISEKGYVATYRYLRIDYSEEGLEYIIPCVKYIIDEYFEKCRKSSV